MNAAQNKGRISELDGLRALAIALVLGSHYPAVALRFFGLPEFGWVGVDIFFVLSGYLITTNLLALRGTGGAYRAFYARRIRRIFPPYFLAIAGTALFSFFFTFHLDVRTLLVEAGFLVSFLHTREIFEGAITSIQNNSVPILFHLPARLNPGPPGVVLRTLGDALAPTWSLSVEEWFYILWAPIVLAFGRWGVIVVAIQSLMIGFFLRWFSGIPGPIWYMDFFCRFDIIAIGALLALWLQFRKSASAIARRRGDLVFRGLGALSVICLAALLFGIRPVVAREIRDSSAFAAFGTPLIGVISASVVAFLVQRSSSGSPITRLFRSRIPVWIGQRSYTIYLVHLPWYWIVCSAIGATGRVSLTAAIAALSLTVLTAAASWRFIESPLLKR